MTQIHTASAGLTTTLRMVGTLVVRVLEAKSGRLLKTVMKRNTITYDAGNIVRSLLAQRATDPSPSSYAFGSMRFGTSTVAPTRADTDLLGEVFTVRKQLLDVQKLDGLSGVITLSATLASGDGNGSVFTEAGIFTHGASNWNDPVAAGGFVKMFSRQIHAALTKNSSVVFDYDWTFQFTT